RPRKSSTHRSRASARGRRRTMRSVERESTRRTKASWLAFPQDKADAADGVDQPSAAFGVDFLAETRDLNINHVVERRRAPRFLPHLARQHLPRDQVALMPEQVFEQLKFADGELQQF